MHDCGDAATRERLVAALVATLQGKPTASRSVKIEQDSQVFEDGAVPVTEAGDGEGGSGGGVEGGGGGRGGSITTYKELCSMATDLGVRLFLHQVALRVLCCCRWLVVRSVFDRPRSGFAHSIATTTREKQCPVPLHVLLRACLCLGH